MIDTRQIESSWSDEHWLVDRPLSFRVRGGRKSRRSTVTQRNLNYLVVKMPTHELPEVGAWLHPESEDQSRRHGFRTAIVRRIESDAGGHGVILMEILS